MSKTKISITHSKNQGKEDKTAEIKENHYTVKLTAMERFSMQIQKYATDKEHVTVEEATCKVLYALSMSLACSMSMDGKKADHHEGYRQIAYILTKLIEGTDEVDFIPNRRFWKMYNEAKKKNGTLPDSNNNLKQEKTNEEDK